MTDRRRVILESAARVIARRGVRGLRVAELAAEAGVSTALVYYHFRDRPGILRHALAFIGDRADRYTETGRDGLPAGPAGDPRERLERMLLLEFQDLPEVRENSAAWGELRAHAVFDPELRDELAAAGAAWTAEVSELLGSVHPSAAADAVTAAAERLTALLEGLSVRWLSGLTPPAHARELLRAAVRVEADRLAPRPASRFD
ncbi:TetR family transcriptional regulator C-terminal domain-containing protein [Streptomyces katrae]|uniref:TetR family transcriptional regulator C-terminal domain-containing protein n=1 Tax=Streptomyces katrae TaxID=68223 RepID=A0ABT7GLY7_9ACTN|nr:TetR family transcriptional regulator C-terminal domain-containing protein [Streptomyces katrae]MDK9494286.1 TetR family transcriptional regulator C-terminal domain-containing protein [Streptomyces katrae]